MTVCSVVLLNVVVYVFNHVFACSLVLSVSVFVHVLMFACNTHVSVYFFSYLLCIPFFMYLIACLFNLAYSADPTQLILPIQLSSSSQI